MDKEKAVIYARYSSHNQREQSIEDQINACKEYAEKHDLVVIGTYADYAQSGRTDKRAEFQRMLHDSKKKQFSVVLIWKIDRFGRDRQDMALNKVILKKNNVRVVSIMENIPETPEGVLIESLMEGMAEYYSLNLAQNVKRGLQSNADQALSNGGNVPEGLKIENKKYVIDEERSPIVRKIFDLVLDGYRVSEVVDYLKCSGIKTRKEKDFTVQTVTKILKNRKYMGEYRYGETVIPDGIPAIVNKDEFEKVQRRLKARKRGRKTPDNDDFILTGKLICSHCGADYFGESGTSKSGKIYKYYKCSKQKSDPKNCDSKPIRKEILEKYVIDKTLSDVLTDEIIAEVAELVNEKASEEDTLIPVLENELNEIESKIANLVLSLEKSGNSDVIINRLNELEERKEGIKKRLSVESMNSRTPNKESIIWFLENMKSGLNHHSPQMKIILNQLIKEILVTDNGLLVAYNVTDDLLPDECSRKTTMVHLDTLFSNNNQIKSDSSGESTNIIILNDMFCVNFFSQYIHDLYN